MGDSTGLSLLAVDGDSCCRVTLPQRRIPELSSSSRLYWFFCLVKVPFNLSFKVSGSLK